MKTFLSAHKFLFIAVIFFIMASCKKEAVQSTGAINSSAGNNSSSKTKTLVLQPGPNDGYDTWLTWKQGDSSITNSNWDTVSITAAYAWTSSGIPIAGRSLIKFRGLSAVPANAQIISATLYMYGIESSPHLPVGNSYYQGSPYPYDNSVAVLRVIENWKPSKVIWRTQPKVTKQDYALIPKSTSQWNYDAHVDVTAMVKKMVADPATNFGFAFKIFNEQIYTCMQFSSSNYYLPGRRPKLEVTYQ